MKKVIVIIALLLGFQSASKLGWFGTEVEKVESTVGTTMVIEKSDTLDIR
jgi:hypothetical protein